MIKEINKNEGIIALVGVVLAILTSFFSKTWALIIFILVVIIIIILFFVSRKKPKSFDYTKSVAKILFIDDQNRQIITNLRRDGFNVKKIDDVKSISTDSNIAWSNIIFVDYKNIGKELFGQKEGLGLIAELKRVFGNKKRYIIYSSIQNFEGLVDFPYIRGNASYGEFISLISEEVSKL